MQDGEAHAWVSVTGSGKPACAGNLAPHLGLVAGKQRRPKAGAMASLVRTGRRQVMRLGQAELGDVLGALIKAPGATRAGLRERAPSVSRGSGGLAAGAAI